MSRFVQVHYGARLLFPERCPFTGAPHPQGRVRLSKSRFQWVLPFPVMRWLTGRRAAHVTLSAARPVGFADALLRFIRVALPFVGILGALVCFKFGDRRAFPINLSGALLAGGFIGSWLTTLLRALVLWRVRITACGRQACEIRFSDAAYAERFAELNSLPLGRERA